MPFFELFSAENEGMEINGKVVWTVKEMAEALGIKPNTVVQRLFQKGIKPLSKDAIYDESALEHIRNFGPKGFQPKKPAPEPTNEAGEP